MANHEINIYKGGTTGCSLNIYIFFENLKIYSRLLEWIQNDKQLNSELTKQRNNKTAKLQNSEKQNSDHNKTVNFCEKRQTKNT